MNIDVLHRLISVAFGVGVLLGGAGIVLYHQLYAEKRRLMLQRDLNRLDVTVTEMRNELDSLRRANRGRSVRRKANSSSLSATDGEVDTDTDVYSAVGTDDDDEFFDFSDEDNV
jgi:hypothetical protein